MLSHVAHKLIPCSSQKSNASVGIPPLHQFLFQLVKNARLKTGTLLVALMFMMRLKTVLPETAQGETLS